MIVNKLEWISEDAEEAILFIQSGKYECAAFSHPCKFIVGEKIINPLLAINVKGVGKVDEHVGLTIERQSDIFSHHIVADFFDYEKHIVSIEGILVEIDGEIPKDILCNDRIELYCSRLDVI